MNEQVEDVYELSPIQLGMLYHSLDESSNGMYSVQVGYVVEGEIDPASFEAAWQSVADRHPVLRTSFHYLGLSQPLQVVHRDCKVPFAFEDWRSCEPAEQRLRMSAALVEENRRGFQLDKPPLLRVFLWQCGERKFRFMWSHHHLLIDGWCKEILFRELFELHRALRDGEPVTLETVIPFKSYIEWRRVQDLGPAREYWQERLRGFAGVVPAHDRGAGLSGVSASKPGGAGTQTARAQTVEPYLEHHHYVSAEASAALRNICRQERLTLNTLVQGAMGLTMSVEREQRDVVFGATHSGRGIDLQGVGQIVGLLINALPVRLPYIEDSQPLVDWLRALQREELNARAFEQVSLTDVTQWSSVPKGRALFDELLVFENNAGYGERTETFGDITLSQAEPVVRNNYPLTFRLVPGAALEIHVLYESAHHSAAAVARLAARCAFLLERFSDDVAVPLGELLAASRHRDAELEDASKRSRADRLQHRRRRPVMLE